MSLDDGEHLEHHAGDAERLGPRVGPELRRSRESLLLIPTGVLNFTASSVAGSRGWALQKRYFCDI